MRTEFAVIFAVTLAVACGQVDEQHSNVSGGGAGPNSNHGGLGGYGPEFCFAHGWCTDGVIAGVYGIACSSLTVACDNGCNPSASQVEPYSGSDRETAIRCLREALCAPALDASDTYDGG